MPESRKASLVDGWTALRAAQRAADRTHAKTRPGEDRSGSRSPNKSSPPKVASHIGRTVMPTRYEVICYDCGYAFQQTGKSRSTVCPKCHHQLDFIDYTIDKEWSESLKTAGTIRITRQGIIKAGELVGAHIILKGEVKGGTVRALQRLELCPACTFAEEHVTGQDLCIGQGVELTLKRKHTFRHVEIHGTLKAVFKSTGLVSIAATGLMQGEIDGTRLAVETGGGLKGAFRFVPA